MMRNWVKYLGFLYVRNIDKYISSEYANISFIVYSYDFILTIEIKKDNMYIQIMYICNVKIKSEQLIMGGIYKTKTWLRFI
jgi:hypothetical protein